MKRIKLTVEIEFVYTGTATALDKILPEASTIAHRLHSDMHNICVASSALALVPSPVSKLEEIK